MEYLRLEVIIWLGDYFAESSKQTIKSVFHTFRLEAEAIEDRCALSHKALAKRFLIFLFSHQYEQVRGTSQLEIICIFLYISQTSLLKVDTYPSIYSYVYCDELELRDGIFSWL